MKEDTNIKKDFDSEILNKVNRFLSFCIEAGDRPFAEAYFIKSLNNQMALNKVDVPTQQMIDVAKLDALISTWQDTNTLTKTMSNFVRVLNNGKEFGMGTLLQPFIKTPTNLVKMMVQLSPAGMFVAVKDTNNFTNALNEGRYDATLQKKSSR